MKNIIIVLLIIGIIWFGVSNGWLTGILSTLIEYGGGGGIIPDSIREAVDSGVGGLSP